MSHYLQYIAVATYFLGMVCLKQCLVSLGPQEISYFYLQENQSVLAPKYKPECSSIFPPGEFFSLTNVTFFME